MRREFAESYGALQSWHWWFWARRRILERVAKRILDDPAAQPRGVGRGRLLVSVGSGPPASFAWLATVARGRDVVVGLDADEVHISNPVGAGEGRANFVVGSITEPPFLPGSCSLVVAADVLEHVEDDVAVLRQIGSLLSPTGTVILTVPAYPFLWGGQDIVSHHFRRYTRSALLGAFEKAGLGAPYITHFNTFLFPAVAGVRLLRRVAGKVQPRSDFAGARPGVANRILAAIFIG